jgi:hypothetical protein
MTASPSVIAPTKKLMRSSNVIVSSDIEGIRLSFLRANGLRYPRWGGDGEAV